MKELIFACILFSGLQSHAQAFKAAWISPSAEQATEPNSWYSYRKVFVAGTPPKSMIANIATDTKYWLWINGKLVVYEGGLKRGPNPNDTYYDEVDLARHIRAGKNSIALLVWFWGGKGFSHNNSGRSALLFDCNDSGLDLSSDKSWKAIRYKAYLPSTAPKPNFRLSEPNILFDAGEAMRNWTGMGFNDSAWKNAIEVGSAPMAPWNKLVKRNIPLFEFDQLKLYPAITRNGDTVICKLPYDGHFSPYLKIQAPRGKRIFMSSDTWWLGTYPGDTLNTLCSEYITRDGLQEYESYGWLSGHEIRYVTPPGVKVEKLMYRETGYASKLTGTFTCNDKFLNTLWKKAQRTLFVNMRDNYMDCPDRERAQWAGDGVMELQQAFYALDNRSTALGRKLYLDLANWQKPDSVIYNPVPESDWKKELPAHSLMPLNELWTYFLYTKDTALLKTVYPAMKRYLLLWKMQDTGELIYRQGGWDWGDWGDNIDVILIQHGWYLLALQTAEKIAVLTGEQNDRDLFANKINRISSYLNSADCWNGKAYHYKDYKKKTDDRANALMLRAGVADSSKWRSLINVFLAEEHASPWMEKFVLEGLIKMNQPTLALERMKKRYQAMVASKLTTLWESWEHKEGVVHGNSGYNHGWAGGPLILLSQYYAGIGPDDKKLNTYIIKPMLNGLKRINAKVPTPSGNIEMYIRIENNQLTLSCNVPTGLTARIGLPKQRSPFKKITCNQLMLAPSTRISIKEEDAQYFWVEVKNGKYDFKATW